MGYNNIKVAYSSQHDDYDPWGSVMDAWFAICDLIHFKYEAPTPDHWEYKAGLTKEECDDDLFFFNEVKDESLDDLIRFGNVLCRYARFLRMNGKDY